MNVTVVAGSNRKDATSTLLAKYIAKVLNEQGAQAKVIDLFENPLPFYYPYQEQNEPNLLAYRQSLLEADAIVLATPEYHGSLSGVLKNALDFVGFDHFDGKPVLSVSSAGGALGVSSLQQLQTIVRNVHGINCPEWISIGGAQRTFTAEGEPEDVQTRDRVVRTVTCFVKLARQLRG